jgi:hypothetical protein
MNYTVVADVHLGNHGQFGGSMLAGTNDRARLIASVLRKARYAAEARGSAFAVLGDLFDNAHPNPQTITLAKTALGENVLLLMGNHDRNSDLTGDHALGPLDGGGLFVCAERAARDNILFLPFYTGVSPAENLRQSLHLFKDCKSLVVCMHVGLRDKTMTEPWIKNASHVLDVEEAAEILKEHGVKLLLSGDWHTQRAWHFPHCQIYQVGALVPTGWDNPGRTGYGVVIHFDSARPLETLDFTFLEGPRFLTLDFTCLASCQLPAGRMDFVRVMTTHGDVKEARQRLDSLQKQGLIAGYQVIVDKKIVAEQAEQAARTTRDAKTLEESLAAFVHKMPISGEHVSSDAPILRRRVLEDCKMKLGV